MVTAIIKNIFNRKSAATAQPEAPRNPYEKLRGMALGMSQVEQIQPTDAGLYALLCEYEVSGDTVTEVYNCEGSASMYFSTGTTLIGAGNHEQVRSPTKQLLNDISGIYQAFPRLKNNASESQPDQTRFIFVGANQTHMTSGKTEEMFNPNHRLHSLFMRVNEIRTEIRKLEQSRSEAAL